MLWSIAESAPVTGYAHILPPDMLPGSMENMDSLQKMSGPGIGRIGIGVGIKDGNSAVPILEKTRQTL